MHEGKRPGGLTALAVFNFVGAGLDLIGLLGVIALVAFGGKFADEAERGAKVNATRRAKAAGLDPGEAEFTAEERDAIGRLRMYERLGPLAIGQMAGLVACAGLLVAAGVGFLRQRRWGRVLANIYVLVSVASAILDMRLVPPEYGGGFRFAALLAFLYPALTLFFVNGTFREDLSR